MSSQLLKFSRFAASTRLTTPTRAFSTSRIMSIKVDSNFISQITAAEKTLTNSDEPRKGGPTAAAQSHVGQDLTAQVVHDITMGERSITGQDSPVQNGPTSVAQSALTSSNSSSPRSTSASSSEHTGRLDSSTIAAITEKEKQITGADGPTQGGPTARAQQHAGEPITSQALHDITEGEKKVTGGERVKGGPTSKAQSELGKSRA
jgi:hypothetical protein